MDTAPHAGFSSRIDETESNRSSDASDTPASESVYGAVAELTSLDDSHQAAALDGIVEEGEEYADGDGPTVFGVAEALYDFTSEVEGDLQFKVSSVMKYDGDHNVIFILLYIFRSEIKLIY